MKNQLLKRRADFFFPVGSCPLFSIPRSLRDEPVGPPSEVLFGIARFLRDESLWHLLCFADRELVG
jgi:hypothetical protein